MTQKDDFTIEELVKFYLHTVNELMETDSIEKSEDLLGRLRMVIHELMNQKFKTQLCVLKWAQFLLDNPELEDFKEELGSLKKNNLSLSMKESFEELVRASHVQKKHRT